jgi:hypothetical protein
MNSPDKPAKKFSIAWPIIFGVCVGGMLGAMLIPAAVGARLIPMITYTSPLWFSLFVWSNFRYRGRTGWHGGVIGAVAGLLVWMLAVYISAYVRASGG